MPFEKTVDENNRITKDFKQIAKECFSNIFTTLGKNNFIRWVQLKRFSKDVENLVFDWMTEEEKEANPTWDGFANKGKNQIKIRKPKTAKGTSIHEIYHILSNSKFCVYLDEGLTEYLKGMSSEEGAKSYGENVRLVSFLHEMLGDSIIKAYLMGEKEQFDKKFIDLICLNKENRNLDEIRLNQFYSMLEARHWFLHPRTEEAKKEDNSTLLKETKRIIQNMINDIIYGKVHKIAQNMDFYKDGKLDFNYAHSIISNYIQKVPADFRFDLETQYNLEKELLEDIYENSHLGLQEDAQKKEEQKNSIVDSIIKYKVDENGSQSLTHSPNNPENVIGGEDIALQVFERKFKNTQNMELSDFIGNIIYISDKFNISQRQLDAVISQYAIKFYGEKINVALIDNLIKSGMRKSRLLNKLGKEKESNTIESNYRKIGENTYIEKRDNQYFYVKFGENGEMSEVELKWSSRADKIYINRMNPSEIRPDQKNGNVFYRIQDNGIKSTIISIGKTLDSVTIHNGPDKYASLGVMNFDELRKYETVEPLIYKMKRKVLTEYMQIEDDDINPYEIDGVGYTADIDFRSRAINVDALKKDIYYIGKLLPQGKSEVYQQILVKDAISQIFGVSELENEEIKNAYDTITKQIISGHATEKSIEEYTKVLNEARRKIVKENKRHAVVTFRDEKAKKEYIRQQGVREVILEGVQKRKAEDIIRYFPAGKYCRIDEPLESVKSETYGLYGTYLVGEVKDDRERKIDIDKLVEDMPEITKDIQKEKVLSDLQRRIVGKIVARTYLINQNVLKKNQNVKRDYETLCSMIYEKIASEKEINDYMAQKCMDTLNQSRRENQKYGDGQLVGFVDEPTKIIYFQLSKLSKMLTEHEFKEVADGIVASHNLMYNKGENNAEIEQQ